MSRPMSNRSLNTARKVKNDEFYTHINDIIPEMMHHKKRLKGKRIYCNCDDPASSKFVEYFKDRFEDLGLKSVTATGYKLKDLTKSIGWTVDAGGGRSIKTDGDCFSETNRAILAESDVVVTNPPFSLFRKYMDMLMEWGGDFCIVGGMDAVSTKSGFSLVYDGKMWLGASMRNGAWFDSTDVEGCNTKTIRRGADGEMERWNGRACWFTNMDFKKRYEPVILRKTYSPKDYPHYDDIDAIEVNLSSDMPRDFPGEMGVPVNFLRKINPDQFDLLGLVTPRLNGKTSFKRILVRNRNPKTARKAA